MKKKTIFVSYSWNDKNTILDLEDRFSNYNVELIRDERGLNYKQSIKEFMKSVRETDYVLMMISESYLKSTNCMYEVLEFVKDENYKDKILPLIHSDTNIFNPVGRIKYIRYWEEQYKNLKEKIEGLDQLNISSVIEDIKKTEEISRKIGEFLSVISDMNNIVLQANIEDEKFGDILNDIGIPYSSKNYYILSKVKTLSYRTNTFQWWVQNKNGYTINIKSAGIFSLDEVNDIVKEYSPYTKITREIAIPIDIANKIFQQPIVPYSNYYLSLLYQYKENIIGELTWDLPEYMF